LVGRSGPVAAPVPVDLDLFPADLLVDLALLLDDVLLHADALLRHDALLGDDLLLVEDDLVLLVRQLGPSWAAGAFASVIGSRSTRTSSRSTGTVWLTCSDTTYLRSRARPLSRWVLPIRSSSSERVIAWSVSGPETSWPVVPPSWPTPPVVRSWSALVPATPVATESPSA
jgi:hypothetical protein